MDEYTARKAEGYKVSLEKVIETTPTSAHSQGVIANDSIPDASSLCHGFYFFKIFECLFADLILSFEDHENSRNFFREETWSWKNAFEVIEVELGLMYDILFTKAVLTYTRPGIFYKFVSFTCTLSSFITFYYLLDKEHINYDHTITFVLFARAIFLEIYAFIVLLCSSWGMFWLSRHKNWGVDLLYKPISCFQRWLKLSHTKRWSNMMSQFNLISFCLKDEPIKFIKIQKLLYIYQFFEKSNYTGTENVPEELKILIFNQLKDKSGEALDIAACKKLCAHRGDRVLKRWNCDAIVDWSIKVEFDQSILLWHIATDLCYYSDESDNSDFVNIQECITSRLLSNYMLYLLVMCPFMLPTGIGQMRFDHTCAEANELLQEREYISKRNEACNMILQVNTEILPSEVKGDRSKSVLFDACRLAKSIHSLEKQRKWSKKEKWEMMSLVWVEMLCYAASHCRGLDHAKQLSKGGELLTHVWLLMAHLGITEQFQISQGHARVKLVLK